MSKVRAKVARLLKCDYDFKITVGDIDVTDIVDRSRMTTDHICCGLQIMEEELLESLFDDGYNIFEIYDIDILNDLDLIGSLLYSKKVYVDSISREQDKLIQKYKNFDLINYSTCHIGGRSHYVIRYICEEIEDILDEMDFSKHKEEKELEDLKQVISNNGHDINSVEFQNILKKLIK